MVTLHVDPMTFPPCATTSSRLWLQKNITIMTWTAMKLGKDINVIRYDDFYNYGDLQTQSHRPASIAVRS